MDTLHGTGKTVDMNPIDLRMECLRLAVQRGVDPEATVMAAQAYFAFALSPEYLCIRASDRSGAERTPPNISAENSV